MVKLVRSNLRKDKVVLIIFLLIIILATFLMQTGSFFAYYEKLYNEKVERENCNDVSIYSWGDLDSTNEVLKTLDVFSSYELCREIAPSDVNYGRPGAVTNAVSNLHIYKKSDDEILRARYIDIDESYDGPLVYINIYSQGLDNYKVGESMIIDISGGPEIECTIAGIYEDLTQGSTYAFTSMILDDHTYDELDREIRELEEEGGEYMHRTYVSAFLSEATDPSEANRLARNSLNEHGIWSVSYDRDILRTAYASIPNVLAGFVMAFSLVAMAICLIMMIFTINNNIDRDIKNIGALRAVGHTNKQIRMALICEYLIIGLAGTFVGVILSYLTMPMIDRMLVRSIAGYTWDNRFYPTITFVIVLAVPVLMTLIVWLSTLKLRSLHPATALRFGLRSHSFKRNHIPLAETRGNVNLLLAIKNTLQNKGQNLILLGILTGIGFMAMFTSVLLYNSKVDLTSLQKMISEDTPDAYIGIQAPVSEMEDIRSQLEAIPGVSQVYGRWWGDINAQGVETYIIFTDRPEYLDYSLVEGDKFEAPNEVVIGKVLADEIGVGIGDEIEIETGDGKGRFLITGYFQSIMSLGKSVICSLDAASSIGLKPDFDGFRIRVENVSSSGVDEVLALAQESLGDKCTSIENNYDFQRSSDNTILYVITLLVFMLVIFNVVIMILVIQLLLKSVFIKREKEFGIKKAVGFTSRQLRLQLALSLAPIALIASLAGSVIGLFLVNPLISQILSRFGIINCQLKTCLPMILYSTLLPTVLIFALTYIMSRRMKKVSAYGLITE